MEKTTKNAIIIGATAGIGRELAIQLNLKGYRLGLTGRREELLNALREELPGDNRIAVMDVTQLRESRETFNRLCEEMGDVELVILNAGISAGLNPDWETLQRIIDTNVSGFVALGEAAFDYFSARGGGHIVGISSMAALLGLARSRTYSASKAFVSNYMQGLRHRSARKKLNIIVTDIKPGFVETEMTEGKPVFWQAPLDKAVRQMVLSIEGKRRHAYITRRWRLVAWTLKLLPEWLFLKLPL
ncbi:MAG: SDR family NAD(P)-dependent oxidoreductase [Calditrichaeota bacterium]|nr:SDR family NAD(P)-dependent oxidoreductase [Calditrichota bacterium]HQU70678.1 SDR family NAD(P)-dependent oxidoreductase [Calditrichia bacterium]